jgi:VRR-NUC domain
MTRSRKPISKKYMAAIQALYGTQESTPSLPLKKKRSSCDEAVLKPETPSEAEIQMQLVAWARKHGLPLISIPNAGKRSLWAGQRERAMGLTAGVSDLFLAMPQGNYHGAWIELKAKGKKPSPIQLEWLQKMFKWGYYANWYDNLEEAKAAIAAYAGIKYPNN